MVIEQWCHKVSVVFFNSGRYDLNLIREHFVDRLTGTTQKARVAKSVKKIMLIMTNGFRFYDIKNNYSLGTSYGKWVKAEECESVKSWHVRVV